MQDALFMVEQKDTEKQSISVKKSWLEKLFKEANREDKIPVVALTIDNLSVYLITEYDFINYKDLLYGNGVSK